MADPVATSISLLALGISALTAWLTYFRRGTIRSTRPTVIYFGPDAGGVGKPKVYLRTLLFSTAKRGRVIEGMHVTLSRNETRQTFNIWVYGDEKLVRGSGLFVGETGVPANHHFLAPSDGTQFEFLEGEYELRLVAKILGDSSPMTLLAQSLSLTRDLAAALRERGTAIFFDWGPDSQRYIPHIDRRQLPQPPLDPLADLAPLPIRPLPLGVPGHP